MAAAGDSSNGGYRLPFSEVGLLTPGVVPDVCGGSEGLELQAAALSRPVEEKPLPFLRPLSGPSSTPPRTPPSTPPQTPSSSPQPSLPWECVRLYARQPSSEPVLHVESVFTAAEPSTRNYLLI